MTMTKTDAITLQTNLNTLGFLPKLETHSGIFGNHSRTGVIWFQTLYGIKPVTGEPDPATVAAVAAAIAGTLKVKATKKVWFVHGLGGEALEQMVEPGKGLDGLSVIVGAWPGYEVFLWDEGDFGLMYTYQSDIETAMQAAIQAGHPVGLVDHSLGANMGWMIGDNFKQRGLKINFIGGIDQVWWSTNRTTAGIWGVSSNIKVARSYRSNQAPGGGHAVRDTDNKITDFREETFASDSHIGVASDPKVWADIEACLKAM